MFVTTEEGTQAPETPEDMLKAETPEAEEQPKKTAAKKAAKK